MPEESSAMDAGLARASNPLVFISHDTRDADLAEAFSNLLKSVSAGVLKSFRTSDRRGSQGIEYGIEWYPEIIKNIQSASDVVCLLTERSVDRPWILFEAGMAKGKLDTPILGVALGIELKTASTGPFAQFQNCADDEDSLTKLVFQLVNRIPGSEPDKDTIRFQVGKFKSTAEGILNSLSSTTASNPAPKKQNIDEIENSSAKLFEEIKVMFQDLPSRIDRTDAVKAGRRKRRFHPGMVEDLVFGSKSPILGARVGLSFLRDALPWVYDEGSILLSKLQTVRSHEARRRVFSELEELLMFTSHNPYIEKYIIESEDDYRMLRELPRLILQAASRALGEA